MQTSEMKLDGNAIAGLLGEIFAVEMTTAHGTCASCGAVNEVGRVDVYVHAPGTVVRWDGAAWQKYPDTPSAGATYLDLALLPDGNPVVSWPIWNAAGSTTVCSSTCQVGVGRVSPHPSLRQPPLPSRCRMSPHAGHEVES